MAERTQRRAGAGPANWAALLDALYEGSWNAGLARFRSPYAFRGLARANHVLTSSLVRLAEGHANVRRLEMALLRNFRKYAHGEAPRVDSIWHWLALGQHRGLPTRMLDWTYSPLVALHFATEDPADFNVDGVVWCVNFVEANKQLPQRLRKLLDREGCDTFTVEMLSEIGSLPDFDGLSADPFVAFMEPPAIDRRIVNQFALFSLMSDPAAKLQDWLRGHPDLCRQVRIPASLKWEIRDKLDQANVNERVLFPDLDGLSRWLARYYLPTGKTHLPRRAARERTRGQRLTK
jgi:FRG domain-containing protein